jgi:hypothetical protein
MDPKDQARLLVQAYLAQNKQRFQFMSTDYIMTDVRLFVAGASPLLDSELRATVAIWRSLNCPIVLPPTPTPIQPNSGVTKLADAVKKGITTVIDGVDIKYTDGKINIGVSGATAELKKGDTTLTAGVSWGGTLSVEAEKGDFHFAGELSNDHWQIKLSYPEDTAIPDLSTLGKVFGEGEAAMRKMIGSTSKIKSLTDINGIKDAISPNLKPVKDAMEAVEGIAKAPPPGKVSFGLSIGSPDPLPGQNSISPGVQVQATLTIRF